MADNQDQNNNQNTNENNDGNNGSNNQIDNQSKQDTPNIETLLQSKLDEALKDIKGKLDKAYGARDEALKKVAEFEAAKKAEELKRLQEEGKHKEAYEMQLAEEKAKREAAEKRNIELTRDIDLRNALSSHAFRNENALEMAYREVVGQLVQNEQGVWVHKSGANVRDFVKQFVENEDNSFLLKPKVSSGSGNSGNRPSSSSGDKKSLFQMSQEEVLKLAREGKLRG